MHDSQEPSDYERIVKSINRSFEEDLLLGEFQRIARLSSLEDYETMHSSCLYGLLKHRYER